MKKCLLGVCAGVAIYKMMPLIRLLRSRQIEVQVMMTPEATRLVGASLFRAVSGNPVWVDEWSDPQTAAGMDHISATREADVFLIAPASANFIAKSANGIADNLLLTTFLAADCPRFVAPAMNQQMWASPAVGRNVACLVKDGVHVIFPQEGEQACGETGWGRLPEPEQLVTHLESSSDLAGLRVVVSVGATKELIDEMRFISNRSSGKMGFALSLALQQRGADVKIIAAQTTLPAPAGIPLKRVDDSESMRLMLRQELKEADWFFSVAAVADFSPERVEGKIARQGGELTLKLHPTTDILSEVSRLYPQLNCLGFAAEEGEASAQIVTAREKMERKGISWMVANDVRTAGEENCQLNLLHPQGMEVLPLQSKEEAAKQLISILCRLCPHYFKGRMQEEK